MISVDMHGKIEIYGSLGGENLDVAKKGISYKKRLKKNRPKIYDKWDPKYRLKKWPTRMYCKPFLLVFLSFASTPEKLMKTRSAHGALIVAQ